MSLGVHTGIDGVGYANYNPFANPSHPLEGTLPEYMRSFNEQDYGKERLLFIGNKIRKGVVNPEDRVDDYNTVATFIRSCGEYIDLSSREADISSLNFGIAVITDERFLKLQATYPEMSFEYNRGLVMFRGHYEVDFWLEDALENPLDEEMIEMWMEKIA